MRSIVSKCLVLFLFVISLSAVAFGQNVTGTISGTVSDSKGGVVPNAGVTVTNADQKVAVRTITTDDRGRVRRRSFASGPLQRHGGGRRGSRSDTLRHRAKR